MLQKKTDIAKWRTTCKIGTEVFYKEEIESSTHKKFHHFLTPDVVNKFIPNKKLKLIDMY